jgi:hypothetical protein
MVKILILSFFLFFGYQTIKAQIPSLSSYNIIWTSQSKNSSESMPVGGHDIGCNVWVENGSVYLYFGRSNSFDENNALLKSGRVKIDITPNPFADFKQELKLANGYVEISGTNGDLKVRTRLWVEEGRPLIHFEIESSREVNVKAEYQNWRITKTPINSRWVVPSYIDYPGNDIFWYPDTIKTVGNDIIFYHQNNNNDLVLDKEIIQQDLLTLKDSIWNPLKNFVFGGMLYGTNMKLARTTSGNYLDIPFRGMEMESTRKIKHCRINILLHSAYMSGSKEYEKELLSLKTSISDDIKNEFTNHQNWWKDFWEGSWIMINNEIPNLSDSAWQAGRNYNIFRYQMACNSQGEYPTKFNGGLFTFDPGLIDKKFQTENPDFRAWGGGVMTAQNQRLLYWPLLKSGDFSMMPQQFDFYRRALPTAELRTRHYWGHEGGCFTDQMNQAGIVCGREYGWKRSEKIEKGIQWSPVHEYYFTSQLEFSYMILEYYRFSGKDISLYMPLVKSAVRFFDQHYRYRAKQNFGQEFSYDGKYILYPCMALETYSGNVKNPSDVIAALTVLTRELQNLPEKYVSFKEKEYYKLMNSRLPEISRRTMNGVQVISPAEKWDRITNQEFPQLYPVFPWGLFGLGKPELDLAINTWHYGFDKPNQKNYISWHQDAIFCARLGLTDEAKKITLKKLADSDRRFPTFWGPGHDWVPDHNWGGSGMIGLQEMVMQTDGKKICLFPAWPAGWDLNFKLHAPFNTTIEGVLKNGRIVKLKVTPESRRNDVQIMNGSLMEN